MFVFVPPLLTRTEFITLIQKVPLTCTAEMG
jgi:hypothetical protein